MSENTRWIVGTGIVLLITIMVIPRSRSHGGRSLLQVEGWVGNVTGHSNLWSRSLSSALSRSRSRSSATLI